MSARGAGTGGGIGVVFGGAGDPPAVFSRELNTLALESIRITGDRLHRYPFEAVRQTSNTKPKPDASLCHDRPSAAILRLVFNIWRSIFIIPTSVTLSRGCAQVQSVAAATTEEQKYA